MRVKDGPDKGAFYNELFLRGRPDLLVRIQRTCQRSRSRRSSSARKVEPTIPQARKHHAPTPSFRLFPRCRELTREEILELSSVPEAWSGQDQGRWPELACRVKKQDLEPIMTD